MKGQAKVNSLRLGVTPPNKKCDQNEIQGNTHFHKFFFFGQHFHKSDMSCCMNIVDN